MSLSPNLRMLVLIQLLEMRRAQTKALTDGLADIIASGTKAGKSPAEICEATCSDNESGNELKHILSDFYTQETALLVKLGVCEVVPVGSKEEASVEAAEILTRAKGH